MTVLIKSFACIALSVFGVGCAQTTVEDTDSGSLPGKNQQDTMVIFYLYGELLPYNYLDENDSLLTRPLGFLLERAADCEVDKKLVDSVDSHNQKMNLLMVAKYGKDWMEKTEAITARKLSIPY